MEENRLPPDRGPPNWLVDVSPDSEMADPSAVVEETNSSGAANNLNEVTFSSESSQSVDGKDLVSNNLLPSYSNSESCSNLKESRNYIVDHNSSIQDSPSSSHLSSDDKNTKNYDTSGSKNSPDDNFIHKRQERFNELAKNKYRITDPAPYYVYVEHVDKNIGRLFPIRVGHFLYQHEEFRSGITDIVPIGVNRVKIIAKTFNIANKLIDHPVLIENKLRSYVPTFYTQKKGVVKLVDTMFNNEYLWNNIQSEQEIVEIKRLRRRTFNRETGKEEFVDRQTLVITFLGSVLPSKIRINFCTFPVEPWIYPVVKCFACLRFGHVADQCKGKLRCSRCGLEGHDHEKCSSESQFCIQCQSTDHHSNSRKCPAYVRQYNIKKVMAIENLSFKEAEYVADNPSYAKVATHNRFSILNNDENFPSLPKQDDNSAVGPLFVRKPRVNYCRPSYQGVQQKKRKAPESPTSPNPSPEGPSTQSRVFTNSQVAPSHQNSQFSRTHESNPSRQRLTHSFSQRTNYRSQSQAQQNASSYSGNDYVSLRKEFFTQFSVHFDSLIKKILPPEVYGNVETRDTINQFYASFQSIFCNNLNN